MPADQWRPQKEIERVAMLQCPGATGTVTGSKRLVKAAGQRVLVDYGLYQRLKALRLRNWGQLAVEPASADWVVLTHANAMERLVL